MRFSFLICGKQRFTSGHFEHAFIDYVGSNSGAEYTIELKNPATPQDNEVYEGYPVLINNGTTYVKDASPLPEFAPNQFGGKSTFFPRSWNEETILKEVENAVRYNKGLVNPRDESLYKGFSRDEKIEIHFRIDIISEEIETFYPIKK